ncbi:MAG TPA: hypothetical protein VF798_04720 [Burkholderiaceae bacterium]
MSTDHANPIFLEASRASDHPELLVSAVLHLMSHYTTNTSKESGVCVKLASVIERHLKALAGLPTLAPVLRATCQQLSEQWAQVVEDALLQPERQGLLARIMARRRTQ